MSGARVAVVFGGGGAKAAAHLGAARALARAGIVPVRWIGTSMGAVVAAAMAGGGDPARMLADYARLEARDVLRRERFALLKGIWAPAIFRSDVFRGLLERMLPQRSFAELRYACTVTAVERDTGREVAFGTGGEDAPLIDVLAASCALPPWFHPVDVNGRAFYDGGIREPLPLGIAATVDCDVVLAVDVGPGFDEVGTTVIQPPPFVAAADTAIGWLMAGTTQLLVREWRNSTGRPRLVHVRPTNDRGATFAIDRIERYGQLGEAAVSQVLGELK
ncbi:MAG TPA: patatin-like phospholipase family protein [Gemmatimonadales bacterium]|nr:patatin-like phospholipase family protein [Gemmatimonadales bacterium]